MRTIGHSASTGTANNNRQPHVPMPATQSNITAPPAPNAAVMVSTDTA